MKVELREWLRRNPKNSVVNDGGRELSFERYYDEYGIKEIWVDDDEGENEVHYMTVELPHNRNKLINFLLDEVHGIEAIYEEEENLLHIHFDGS